MLRSALISLLIFLAGACCAGDGDFAYRVKCEKKDGSISHGTAGAISPHTLVTAAHVIVDADEIFIDHEIGWLRCKVVKIDAETDLAVIECKSVELKYVPIDTVKRVPGETVTIWASVYGAKIRSIAASIKEAWDAHKWLCSAQGFDHGGSGGPVIHENKLVGVAVALQSEKTKQPLFVASECLQRMLAPETFAGEKLPPPKDTRAEVVELPKAPVVALRPPSIPREPYYDAQPHICRTCGAKPVCAAQRVRHWDSDVDGHGQGGWVYE